MKGAFSLAFKNIKRKPFRAFALIVLVMLLTFFLFIGANTIISLQNGLQSYRERLGADIVVVPMSATSHGAVDDIFLQGITGNYYMSEKEVNKVKAVDGISAITTQFFLTSAKASCCSTRVQIIGFDPQTDFTILPWINESYGKEISDGDVIAGANLNVPENKTLTFYGQDYRVAAQLAVTGTGLDSAVYANMNTVKEMAENARVLVQNEAFSGVDIGSSASAILINVAEGYDIDSVVDDINIHITKVQATSSRSMIESISKGLNSVSRVIGILVVVIWGLSVLILIAVFALLSNERKREFAVLRTLGASRRMLFSIMSAEAGILSLIGALIGLFIAALLTIPVSSAISGALDQPYLLPNPGIQFGLLIFALVLSVCAGLISAFVSAKRITKSETGLLLREDA